MTADGELLQSRLRRAVLAHSLEQDSARGPVAPSEWDQLLAWARAQRVVGLLAAMAGEFDLTESQVEDLANAQHEAALSALAIEASLVAVSDALAEANVDFRVLKGLATARLLYSDPSERTTGDVDVLVRPADVRSALRALEPLITHAAEPEHGPVRTRLRTEWQLRDTRGIEIDLHQAVGGTLVTSRLPVDVLFDAPLELDVAGRELFAPPLPVLFVHAVLHHSTVSRDSTLADIARLATHCSPDDPLLALLLARRSVQQLFVWSLADASRWVPLPPAWHTFLADQALRPRSMRRLDWVQSDERHVRFVNLVTGPHRLRRTVETLWPSEEFLAYHGFTRWQNTRRQLRREALIIPPPHKG